MRKYDDEKGRGGGGPSLELMKSTKASVGGRYVGYGGEMGKKKVKGVMGKKELDEVGVEVSVLGGQGESVHVLDDDIFKRDLMDLRDVPPGNRDEVALCTKSSIRFYSGSKSMRADYAHQQSHHHKTTQTVRVKMISNAPPPPTPPENWNLPHRHLHKRLLHLQPNRTLPLPSPPPSNNLRR